MNTTSYIIDAVRTPIGNFGGTLSTIRTDDLGALTIKKVCEKQPNIPLAAYEDVIFGCANQAGEDNRNVARMCLLLAGLPFTIPGETVNRLCASGMSAVIHANRAIKAGDGDVFIAGGVEHMTRGPFVISKVSKAFGRDARMEDSAFGWRFVNPKMEVMFGTDGMGQTAENLAEKYSITREEQDQFAYWSQMKATKAQQEGWFKNEIVAVEIPQRKKDSIIFSEDEFIKPKTSLEVLAKLRTAFKKQDVGGTVTAGNASGLNDGSAAMIVASEKAVEQYSLKPLAKIVSSTVVGVEPRIMGIGPVGASNKALAKAGLTLADMNVIELNEAFAAQCIACLKEWGLANNDLRVNPKGGAIAIGHPLAVSGTRILNSAALQLQATQQQYALVTMCVGVGQGYAVVLERV